MKHVARFQYLQDGLRRNVRRGLLHHRLVRVGVERFALCVDASHAMAAQRVEQLRLHHRDTLDQRTGVAGFLRGGDSALPGPFSAG